MALGVKFEVDKNAAVEFYCAGFRNEDFSDTAICAGFVSKMIVNVNWALDYSVADDYFTGTTEKEENWLG